MTSSCIAYADCFSGISGDMFLGALIHCGLSEELLNDELVKLNLEGYSLTIDHTRTNGIGGIKVDVHGTPQQQFRHLSSIKTILQNSSLDQRIIASSIEVFNEIARAEAKVHDIDIEKVHFHEVGAIDTIIDVVGTVAGLHHLGVRKLYCSPVPSPRGFVECAHGRLPLPAPAVCEILTGVPCYGVAHSQELVTPTGAALLKVLTTEFRSMPPMIITSTGYGAGSHILPGNQPNLFRLILGTSVQPEEHQEVEIIETHLDDWSPESFPYLCDQLFRDGALDVSLAPIQMKKGRPGFLLKIICPLHLAAVLRRLVFEETTSIGLRYHREYRQTLPRRIVQVKTPWGKLAAKEVETPGGTRVYPEYEECRRIAEKFNIPLQQVYDQVKKETTPS
ncbi:nickel pincer cofactor biosynthesis protein LarC [Desulfopila inferna]|uniref:nickel pincer cofactor biosynthesis protein LarC n=1 Tax=Desulfopila inferna TaxID=468528 RepID=UPI001965B538|nr:nickel pincer cofactor biosynthesis protein LarC [Desulfopila inferna]MBM9605019.1 nickel pincer cofactor biosynthesis protein LarC [Desulfopila inferna]